MYAHCLFCQSALGRNEALEAFPVGRRLAFDAGKGRLWVVCPRCERWNLTPLEERWEAIEAAERLYRESRQRVSTDNVGLARVPDGTTLVRIGRPERAEFAAWRYGDQFGRRRRRSLVTAGAVLAGGGALAAGGVAAGLGVVVGLQLGRLALDTARHGLPFETVARVPVQGTVLRIRRAHLLRSTFGAGEDGRPSLTLAHGAGESTRLHGDEARRAAALLLPAVNRAGGSAADVRNAVARLEHAGDPERFYRSLATRGERVTAVAPDAERFSTAAMLQRMALGSVGIHVGRDAEFRSGLLAMPTSLALAVEMALHEEQERRAMAGELAELARAWREAEEIAAIADDLLLPDAVRGAMRRLRGERPTR